MQFQTKTAHFFFHYNSARFSCKHAVNMHIFAFVQQQNNSKLKNGAISLVEVMIQTTMQRVKHFKESKISQLQPDRSMSMSLSLASSHLDKKLRKDSTISFGLVNIFFFISG